MRRLALPIALAALSACASNPSGNLRESYETISTGDVDSKSLNSLAEVSAEGKVGPDLAYRASERLLSTQTTIETPAGDSDEDQLVNQPSVETVLTSGALAWTQTVEVQDTTTHADPAPDNERWRTWLLEKLELSPEELPHMMLRLDRRTDEDDLFVEREELYSVFQVDDRRGPFEWIYSLEGQLIQDDAADVERDVVEHNLRGTWRDQLFDGRVDAAVTVTLEDRRDTSEFGSSGGGVPPGEVFPTQGLSVLDTTPSLAILVSTPALIDGDELTPTGINIGGFVNGGETSWNIGVGLGLNAAVDRVLLTTDEVVPDFMVSQYSFSVWTSVDNNSWTLVQGGAPFTYDDVNRRFQISFPPVTGLYLKVVNSSSPPGAPAIFVTEMRIFSTSGPGAATPKEHREDDLQSVLGSFSWRTLDNLTLGWDVLAQLAGTDADGETLRDETRFDNTLHALWTPVERVDVSLRADNQQIRDTVLPDQDTTVLSGVVQYQALDTLDFAVSQTWSQRDYAPTGLFETNGTLVRSTAQLLEDLTAEVGFEQQTQDDGGQDITTERNIFFASLVARVTPRLDLTLSWRDEAAELSGAGAAGLPDPDLDNFELLALWRPSNQITTEARLNWRDTPAGTGLDQNLRLDWVPLPDGSIDIQTDFLRRVDGIQELSTDQYLLLLRWLINAKTSLTFNYGAQIPEDADRTDLVTIVLNFKM